jgi:hypothetical protein
MAFQSARLPKIARSPYFYLGCDFNAVTDRARHRTKVGVDSMHPLYFLKLLRVCFEMVHDVNAADDQDVAVFSNLPFSYAVKFAFSGRNSARFQRATQGAGQSSRCRSNHHVERGLMRFVN